jgi:hypothetical protein
MTTNTQDGKPNNILNKKNSSVESSSTKNRTNDKEMLRLLRQKQIICQVKNVVKKSNNAMQKKSKIVVER